LLLVVVVVMQQEVGLSVLTVSGACRGLGPAGATEYGVDCAVIIDLAGGAQGFGQAQGSGL
jgi:hypothetical protein